jgi:hypothetical protein
MDLHHSLLDATGSQFAKGSLQGKFAGTFFSTGSQVSTRSPQ